MSEVHREKNLLDGGIVALKLLLPRDEIFIDLVGEKKLRDTFFAAVPRQRLRLCQRCRSV